MSKQKELEILEKISENWVSYRNKNQIRKDSCILGSNFAHRILLAFEVKHEVVPVGTTVFNTKGWELFGTHVDSLPDNAWHVHCSSEVKGTGFGGHIVIVTDNFFLDITASQFERPQHDIVVGRETLIVPLNEVTHFKIGDKPHPIHLMYKTQDFWTFPMMAGSYSFFFEKWNTIYRKSPDWNVTPQKLGISDVITQMKQYA